MTERLRLTVGMRLLIDFPEFAEQHRMQHPPIFHRKQILGVVAAVLVLLPTIARAEPNARETRLVRALKKARHTVVNIHSQKTARSGGETLFGPVKPRKVNGMGTGIIIDPRGYIATNHHVIDGVDSLRVTLCTGETYMARVLSYDRKHDLAIIKIKASKSLQVMPMGTSSDLMLGESVFAVGNAFGYENTVTSGIISALSRDVEVNATQSYKNLIQTDASINPGNSGGPLINMNGEVIGINVAIRAGAQRIGFAIPIDDARRVVARLMSVEKLEGNYHGLLTLDRKSAKRRELVVKGAERESPASKAGFQNGDVVLKVDNQRVVDGADFERLLLGHRAGEAVKVIVRRKDETKTLAIQLSRHDATTVVRANNESNNEVPTPDDKAWKMLGLQLSKLSNAAALRGSRYRGGMRVLRVRPNSPADINGIREGDVLVGLHVWETVTPENVRYVLNHDQFQSFSPLKFYILRKGETLFGHLRVASR